MYFFMTLLFLLFFVIQVSSFLDEPTWNGHEWINETVVCIRDWDDGYIPLYSTDVYDFWDNEPFFYDTYHKCTDCVLDMMYNDYTNMFIEKKRWSSFEHDSNF